MSFRKEFRGSSVEKIIVTLFILIMLALIIKFIVQCEGPKSKPLESTSNVRMMQHKYNDPIDFANDTNISEIRRMYFKKVFHYEDKK
jgi:hypothetical protein